MDNKKGKGKEVELQPYYTKEEIILQIQRIQAQVNDVQEQYSQFEPFLIYVDLIRQLGKDQVIKCHKSNMDYIPKELVEQKNIAGIILRMLKKVPTKLKAV